MFCDKCSGLEQKLAAVQQNLVIVQQQLLCVRTTNEQLHDRVFLLEHPLYKEQRDQLFQQETQARNALLCSSAKAEGRHSQQLEQLRRVWARHVRSKKEAICQKLKKVAMRTNLKDEAIFFRLLRLFSLYIVYERHNSLAWKSRQRVLRGLPCCPALPAQFRIP